MSASTLFLLAVCVGSVARAAPYDEALTRLASRRAELAASLEARPARRTEYIASAREALTAAFDQELFPAWYGTPWEFYGTTERPREGTIACGYFVSTLLRDAGFGVERLLLAQQASEHIVQTLTPADRIRRFRHATPAEVISAVRRDGDGLYVVGLDVHVAFLRLSGGRADLCHSSYLPPAVVVCEPAATSAAFVSRYYVVGPLWTERLLTAWLTRQALPTVR